MANITEIIFETASYNSDASYYSILIGIEPGALCTIGAFILKMAGTLDSTVISQQVDGDSVPENLNNSNKISSIFKSTVRFLSCGMSKLSYGNPNRNSRVGKINSLPNDNQNCSTVENYQREESQSYSSTDVEQRNAGGVIDNEYFKILGVDFSSATVQDERVEEIGEEVKEDDEAVPEDVLKEEYEELQRRAEEQEKWLEQRQQQILKDKIAHDLQLQNKFKNIVINSRPKMSKFRQSMEEVD